MTVEPEVVGLLAATALHAGFQLTVTLLVYPALAATAVTTAPPGAPSRAAAAVTTTAR